MVSFMERQQIPLYLPDLGIPLLLAALPGPERRALIFSTATRNALVVLPLVLGLSEALAGHRASALMPLALLTQTLVELLALTLLVAFYRTQKSPLPQDGNGDRADRVEV